MRKASLLALAIVFVLASLTQLWPPWLLWSSASVGTGAEPLYHAELIFPLEHWHNHASCIVEAPNGDLLVCWFNGSGERTADDVKIEGARKKRGAKGWGPRFVMADTPGFPDTNCTMFIDPQQRLWLLWPTILANEWHTALMKYKISSNYQKDGPPQWEVSEVLHVKPETGFEESVNKVMDQAEGLVNFLPEDRRQAARDYIARQRKHAADKLFRRLGWMTRAHPLVLDKQRLIVPLYSDGFSFSLMAITDDWGKSWKTSTPLVGFGNIQPSIVRKKDGTLYALMRDNGPAPKRLHQSESRDNGETWSPVTETDLPNPGSGAEIISLKNGHWVLAYNDTERDRNSLAVAISDDEGKSWRWKRHLEFDPPGPEAGAYHYPSIIQGHDGTLHITYSYHLNKKDVGKDSQGRPQRKSIKYVHFNEAWVMAGDSTLKK
jgi:predicted neuraminidase